MLTGHYSQTMTQVLSYDSGISELPLLGDTIGTNLDRTVARFADREALVDVASGRRFTYSELAGEVNVVALGLVQLGIDKGDRVGIWAPNVPEWVVVQYATAKIGAILVTVNTSLQATEFEYLLCQSESSTLITIDGFKGVSYVDTVYRIVPELKESSSANLIGYRE